MKLANGEDEVTFSNVVVDGKEYEVTALISHVWEIDDGQYRDSPPDDSELIDLEVQEIVSITDDAGDEVGEDEVFLEKIFKAVRKLANNSDNLKLTEPEL